MWSFTALSKKESIVISMIGTSQIKNIGEGDIESQTLIYGQVLALFGKPLKISRNLENRYEYIIKATEEKKSIYLSLYLGASGPAIGGFQDEYSQKAATIL